MKLSVSLPDDDVTLLDEFARINGLPSRSAALHHAVSMLRLPELEHDYQVAWDEWEGSGQAAAWDAMVGDGLSHASR